MSSIDYSKLRVYESAIGVSQAVWAMVSRWPSETRWSLGDQLTRACDSVGANIAEGAGRGTYLDNRRFARIARGSLYEAQHWLRLARSRSLMTKEDIAVLAPLVRALLPMLNAYIDSIGKHRSKGPSS